MVALVVAWVHDAPRSRAAWLRGMGWSAVVRTLVEARKPRGAYQVTWDGTDHAGRRLEGGTYFVRLRMEGQAVTTRLLLIR